MYRLFADKGISPLEIETKWTLRMVLDANEALDLMAQAEAIAHERAKIGAE